MSGSSNPETLGASSASRELAIQLEPAGNVLSDSETAHKWKYRTRG